MAARAGVGDEGGVRWPADGVEDEDGDGAAGAEDGDGPWWMGTADNVNALGAPPVGVAQLERQT